MWVVPWVRRLDRAMQFQKSEAPLRDLSRTPGEYVRDHLRFTPFAGEPVGWMIEQAGEKATDEAPLAWLSMENDGSDNVGAALNLRLWPGDHRIDLGRADFHGRWVDWRGDGATQSD